MEGGTDMTTRIIAADDVQAKIPELLMLVSEGYDIVIEKNNKPFAKLTAISEAGGKRIPGLNRGEIWTSEDFDEPLPDGLWLGEK
jgi:antitoxin (DNA-binding transcriptional repressor) of toxin-antitoxin stability system